MGRRDVRVVVVYCAPGCEDVSEVTLAAGATVGDAIDAAGVRARHRDLAATALDVGIWGRACSLGQALSDGDRVEIYRPLIVDPKEARRVRVEVRRRRATRR
jgi:putative ubiquitin-RnfH superfamily antitoxin RatB of RatAB toxin-antitoxin module